MKILILNNIEPPDASRPSGFDHIFSFRHFRWADFFPHDLMTEKEEASIYREVYVSLLDYLKPHFSEKSPYFYRGVNLLWCLKKALFNYAYHVQLHYEILKRLMKKFESGEFYFKEQGFNSDYPSLRLILEASPLKKSSRFHFLYEKISEPETKTEGGRSSWIRTLWPDSIVQGNLEKIEIAFFSDFQKSKSILPHLDASRCAFYTDGPSPHLFLHCLKRQIAFYQAVYDPSNNESLKTFDGDIFDTFSLIDSKSGTEQLMGVRLDELSKETVPRLTFQIDRIHQFVGRVKSLKTVYLDEDIGPVKNAFCQVMRQYGVTSFVESHGVLAHPSGYVPVTADFLFAWGAAQRRKLITWGCPEKQVIISGCSRYDSYRGHDRTRARQKAVKDFGLDPSKKILLIAFPLIRANRPLLFEARWVNVFYETLEEAAAYKRKVNLIVKFKSRSNDQNKKYCKDWIRNKNLEGHFRVIEDYDSLLLARAADVIIAYGTTFAVDGLAMETPVIYPYHPTMPLLEEFKEFEAFYFTESRSELRSLISSLLKGNHPKQASFKQVRKECLSGETDQTAGELIAKCLREGVERTKSSDLLQPLHSYESQNTNR